MASVNPHERRSPRKLTLRLEEQADDQAVDLRLKNRRIVPLCQHQLSANSKASLRACLLKLNSAFWNISCIAPVWQYAAGTQYHRWLKIHHYLVEYPP